jgi:hypothetical protein
MRGGGLTLLLAQEFPDRSGAKKNTDYSFLAHRSKAKILPLFTKPFGSLLFSYVATRSLDKPFGFCRLLEPHQRVYDAVIDRLRPQYNLD